MRVAVTGPGGRLGSALMTALGDAPFTGPAGPVGWGRPDYDLDDPGAAARLVQRDRPDLVIHAAAWTDTEACARQPALCRRRNGQATGELAAACAARGIDLVIVSTNEVFDGRRGDGRGYAVDDPPNPINPYGAGKLAGERAASDAYRGTPSSLAIVRTAWLFGPPGSDFPAKILAAADRALRAGEPLRVVADETGSPTFAPDLAEAIVELAGSGAIQGIHHVVNTGAVTRAGWARELLRQCRVEVPIEEIGAATWPRASAAPAWAVLEPTPLPSGEPLRPWQSALADYVPTLLRLRPAATR
jgi:dTDP-4-dehydrorhamnose reductase